MSDVIDSIDGEIKKLTGVEPKETKMEQRFDEVQEYIKEKFGGGEDNKLDVEYIDRLKDRQEEIKHRLLNRLDAEEVKEVETFEVPEAIEILEVVSREELLTNDGIIIRK